MKTNCETGSEQKLKRLQDNLQEILSDIRLTKKQMHDITLSSVHTYDVSRVFSMCEFILHQQLDDLNLRRLDIERKIKDLEEDHEKL